MLWRMTLWNLRRVTSFSWDQQAQVIWFYPHSKVFNVIQNSILLLMIAPDYSFLTCAKDREDITSQNPCSVCKCPICDSRCNNTYPGKFVFIVMLQASPSACQISCLNFYIFLWKFCLLLHRMWHLLLSCSTVRSFLFKFSPSSCLSGQSITLISATIYPIIWTFNDIFWHFQAGYVGEDVESILLKLLTVSFFP